jgi:hypothetical protein
MTVLTPACGPTAPVVAGKDARAAVGQQTVTPGKGTLHSFTLHNTSGVASTQTIARLGLAFLKGDVPAGKRIAVRQRGGPQIAFAGAAATNTWADGSLRSTADGGLVMFDGVPLPAGGSRSYEVFVKDGAVPASGFDPFAWLAAHGNDLTVAVTARTGSATGPRPDLLFSLKTAIATTTRREILCNTRRFVRIKAWQKVSQEEHLICEYHLDFWLDGTGQPWGLEFAPVLTQHWWVADPFGVTQTKERQTYDATVKYGTTVLDTRTRLDHAYYCRWASLRPQDDAQHARKHWIGLGLSQMPTVRVQYDDSSLKRMMKAGYIPPFRLGVNYTGDFYPLTSTYTPLGTNGHRAGINGTGAYVGRGMWGDPDAKLVSRQGSASADTAEGAWRAARVMAQAGMSAYFHVRDHRSSSGVNGGTDAPNRLMPSTLRKATTLSLSQSYSGLGSHLVYAIGSMEETTGLTTLADVAPVGGTGAFGSYDTAHACSYSGPMAFLEGEAFLGDAAISAWNRTVYHLSFNRLAADAGPLYWNFDTRRTAQSIPSSTGSGFGTTMDATQQDRCLAWCVNLLTQAYALRADNHPEQPFIKNFVRNFDYWLSQSYGYFPTGEGSHYERGGAWIKFGSAGGRISPWMNYWQGLPAYQMHRLAGEILPENARGMTGFEEAGYLSVRLAANCFKSHPYALGEYQQLWGLDANGLSPLPLDEWPYNSTARISSDIFTATPPFGMVWTNGDKLRIPAQNSTLGPQTIPHGLSTGTLYYLINASGSTFQLATSPGGTPVTAIANATNVAIMVTMEAYKQNRLDQAYYFPSDDSYFPFAMALLELGIAEGHSDIAAETAEDIRAFFSSKVASFSNYAPWNYDGDLLKSKPT